MNDKSKDPAFLFYSSDFITGTLELTNEEVGQYIKMMCYQHQKGHLSKNMIDRLIPNISEFVLEKFIQDKKGNYYNKRLDEEIEKRAKHAEKQRINGAKGGRPKKANQNPKETQTYPNQKPLENENEIANENINEFLEIKEEKNLFEYVESIFGRTVSQPQLEQLIHFRKEFSDDVIKLAFKEADLNNARNFKYVQAILDNWHSQGIKTIAEAQSQISSFGNRKIKVQKEMTKEDKLNAIFGD